MTQLKFAALSCPDLGTELAAASLATSILHFKALERLGVSRDALCDLTWQSGRGDWSFGIANVCDAGDGLYYPGDGKPHLILPVFDDGELVDLCAFQTTHPRSWLLRSGLGWALGLGQGLERHTWGDSVPLAVSPLEWLQDGAAGLCILDWDAPELHYLLGVPHLVCSSGGLASRLRAALTKPVRFPQISIGGMSLAA